MKFIKYLNEGRTKPIEHDDAVKLVTKNCRKNFHTLYIDKNPIYRGLPDNFNTAMIDSDGDWYPRKSRNTKNYMTLLMDNLPSWKKYPKRSKSIICSTSRSKAQGYGHNYHVIPYDNTNIGICSRSDVWFSFKSKNLNGLDTVNVWNDELKETFEDFNIDTDDNEWKKLKHQFKGLSLALTGGGKMINKLKKYYNLDNLNNMLSPEENGFKIGIQNMKHDREVWIQGKSILVKLDYSDDFIQDVMDELRY